MKKSLSVTLSIATSVAFFITSCASAPKDQPQPQIEQTEEIERPKTPQVPRKLNVVNSSISAQKEETEESIYAKKIEGIRLSVVSSPKETTKGKAFSSPFVFKAEKTDGTPVAGLELSISFPETKINGQPTYSLANLTTNSSGTVIFVPATPAFSFNSKISVYPSGDVTNAEIAKLAEKVSVSAPYKVKTNLYASGGTVAIVDFNASGKPILSNSVSSSNLLMALMRSGFVRIGNADFSNAILTDDIPTVYKTASNLVGSNSAYLIFGKVKYLTPIEKNADQKYTLTLEGNITCLDMKTGSILCELHSTATVTEDKDWNCLNSARKLLAENLAHEIIYGL